MKKSTLKKVIHKVSVTQIPENALLRDVISELRGREMFVDADPSNTERIYSGDIFEAILNEQEGLTGSLYRSLNKKAVGQLEELAKLVNTEYVQITNF
jgi:hypothetical protein